MGANIAGIYAGSRPERLEKLVMLDFLGLKPMEGVDAPAQLRAWLEAVQKPPRLRVYPEPEGLVQRLMAVNPRLTRERALFLAGNVGHMAAEGGVQMACDPWHKIPSPHVYRVEDVLASWKAITAPVLMLIAEQGFVQQRFGHEPEEYQRRLSCFADLQVRMVPDAGHNVQHDQPEMLAGHLEQFLSPG